MHIATVTANPPRDRAFDTTLFKLVMVLIFFLFGYAKWFDYEAQGLIHLTSNSPFLAWMHHAFGPHIVSYFLGVMEWTTGSLLLLGLRWQLPALIGAAASCLTFAVTTTMIWSRTWCCWPCPCSCSGRRWLPAKSPADAQPAAFSPPVRSVHSPIRAARRPARASAPRAAWSRAGR